MSDERVRDDRAQAAPLTVRVRLPYHLRTLAGTGAEIHVPAAAPLTLGGVLDAVEAAHPVLRGALRDRVTQQRRPLVRFFACREDYSHAAPETVLPAPVAAGTEPFLIIGAIAGG